MGKFAALVTLAATTMLLAVVAPPHAVDPDERLLLDYFVKYRTPAGLVQDRSSDPHTVSVAATGFGMDVWAIAARLGILSDSDARAWCRTAFRATLAENPPENRGWLAHFTDEHGTPKPTSEVSTIDSAIFYLGARQSARRLGDREFLAEVERAIATVDVDFVTHEDGLIRHGFHRTGDTLKMIPYRWDTLSEGMLVYHLFERPFAPPPGDYDLPLFVYYYPLCFYHSPDMHRHLERAIEKQQQTRGVWGLTATDGPAGYTAFDESLVSPLAAFSLTRYTPKSREFSRTHPVPRTTGGYHLRTGWRSPDLLGIDCGAALLLRHPAN